MQTGAHRIRRLPDVPKVEPVKSCHSLGLCNLTYGRSHQLLHVATALSGNLTTGLCWGRKNETVQTFQGGTAGSLCGLKRDIAAATGTCCVLQAIESHSIGRQAVTWESPREIMIPLLEPRVVLVPYECGRFFV